MKLVVGNCLRISLICFFTWFYLRKITSLGKLISMNGYKLTLRLGIAFAILWFVSLILFIITGYGSLAATTFLISLITIGIAFLAKYIAGKIADYIQDSTYDTSNIISQVKDIFRLFFIKR